MEFCRHCQDMFPGKRNPSPGKVYGMPIPGRYVELDCQICDGTGEVPDGQAARIERGEQHRKRRLDDNLSLRIFCKKYDLDPVLVSQYEFGKDVSLEGSPYIQDLPRSTE